MSRTVTGLGWVAPATIAISVHVAVAFVPVEFGGADDSSPPPVKLAIEPPPAVEAPPEPAPEPPEPPIDPPIDPPPESPPPQRPTEPPPARVATEPPPEPEPHPEPPQDLGLDTDFIAEGVPTSALPPIEHAFAAPPPPPAPPAAEVDLSGYRDGLHRALNEARRYPLMAKRLGLEGEAKVKIAVRRDGSLRGEPEIVRSTGHDVLDEEVVRLTREAAPFAPLPEGYADDEAEFLVPVVFQLAR